jgi:hypothetical protein
MHVYLRDDAGVLFPVMIEVRPSPLARLAGCLPLGCRLIGGAGIEHAFRCQCAGLLRGTGRLSTGRQLGQFGRNRSNVWHYPEGNSFARCGEEGNLLALHPTVKPVAMVADAILDSTARGEIVLDAFLGSGTTVIAAERTGRRCYGLELDPVYVDTIIRRWQALTGSRARHAASGLSFGDLAREAEAANAA